MKFCGQCGSALSGRFCGSCGWGPAPEAEPAAAPDQAQETAWHDEPAGGAAPSDGTEAWTGYDEYAEHAEYPEHAEYAEHPETVRYDEAAETHPVGRPRRRGLPAGLLAFLIVLLLGGLGAVAHTLGRTDRVLGGEETAAPTEPAEPDPARATDDATTGDEEQTADGDVTQDPTDDVTDGPSEEPTEEATEESTEDEFPTPITDPYSAAIEFEAEGSACETDNHVPSPYGNYAYASCRTWQDVEGLGGHHLTKGDLNAVCQSDLGIENPSFLENQANTWWFWAESDTGEYDWFPHTALAQGETNQPVVGIPHCEF